MNRALYAAASGMDAEQQSLTTIAENLSNAEVTAYKQQTTEFHSMLNKQGEALGVIAQGTKTNFTQGRIETSGGPCDLALRGEGFFVVEQGAQRAYTRVGNFHRTADGCLENADGWRLTGVHVPATAQTLQVDENGLVSGLDSKRIKHEFGHIAVVQVQNPAALQEFVPQYFRCTPAAGSLQAVHLGQNGSTRVLFGHLERANVSIVDAMIQILDTQRAYEADAKGVQAADEMVRIANNLQRG